MVHELIRSRSPHAFSERPLPVDAVASLVEAAPGVVIDERAAVPQK
jgi:hypothetical protein